jgi:enterochelin esterase family protein
MAACYSPNPVATGLAIDYPCDLYTGELRPDVWARWLTHDPVELVERYAANLRQLRYIFVDCGTRDEFNLQYGARILVQRLRAAGIDCEHDEFDDDHRSIGYRYDVSVPKLVAALGA